MLATADSAEGVFHLGGADSSDEIEFSSRLAHAFGYDPKRIVEDGISECNAMMMNRFRKEFPKYTPVRRT